MSYFDIPSTMKKVSGTLLELTSNSLVISTEEGEIHAVPEKFPEFISVGDNVSGHLHSYPNQRVLCFSSKLPTYIIVQ
jgi:hypothetical protein